MNEKNLFNRLINFVIRGLLSGIVFLLFLHSIFSTSFVGVVSQENRSAQERTLNISDSPWKHLLVFAVVTGIILLLRRAYRLWQTHQGEKSTRRGEISTVKLLSVFVLVMGTLWIMITQLKPGSDPAKVYEIAMQWRKGNFSSFAEGGYLFRYPFQSGIVLFYYLLTYIVGIDNYVGLQFINVIALVAIYAGLVKSAALFWKQEKVLPTAIHIALIAWIPLFFYVTYLYGILPGMALSVGAIYFAVRYLDSRQYRYILMASLCMGLATVIKMNCLIYLIAIACFLFYDTIDILFGTKKELGRKWVASLVFILLMGLSVMGFKQVTDRYVEHLSGYELADGEVMVSWVVMGLQETPLGPGGYSGYIGDVFLKYEYDSEQITEASIADIKKILTRMMDDPLDEGLTFFARKTAFQWNDPSFIGMDRTKGRSSAVVVPEFVASLIEGKGSVGLYVLLNYAQTLILIGVLLYAFLNGKSNNIYELIGAVVFLGGYMFHLIWESSASYTIPYFVILIPYAVKGLADWGRVVDRGIVFIKGNKEKGLFKTEQIRKMYLPAGAVLAVFVLITALYHTNVFHNTIALDDGEEAVNQFYHAVESSDHQLQNGYFYLSPYADRTVAVAEQNGEIAVVSDLQTEVLNAVNIANITDLERKILVQKEEQGTRLRFRSNEQVLAVDHSGDIPELTIYMDDGMNMFYQFRDDINYEWKLKSAGDGSYYIVMNDMALTYRNGTVELEECTESDAQKWVLQ